MISADDDRTNAEAGEPPPARTPDVPVADNHPTQGPPGDEPAPPGGETADRAGPSERPRRRRRRRRRPAKPPEGTAAPPPAHGEGNAAAAAPDGDGQVRERLTIKRPETAAPAEGTPANRTPRPPGRARRRPRGRPSGAETPPRDGHPGTDPPPREGRPAAGRPPRERRPGPGRPPGEHRGSAEQPREERPRETGARGPGGQGKPGRGRGKPGPRNRPFGGDRGPPKRPERVMVTFEAVVDRGFEDVADEANEGATRRVTWTIVKRTVADQRTTRPVSAVYLLQRDGVDTEFANLGAARAAVNKTIVHPEKLTRAKAEYAAAKKK